MINEEYLMIGNCFYFPFHNQNIKILGYEKIEKDDSFKVQFETNGGVLLEPLGVLEPIPLTEDILVNNCGFVKYNNSDSEELFGLEVTKDLFIEYASDFSCGIWSSKNRTHEIGVIPEHENIKYLHGLQNLVKILTGKELEIKFKNIKP